MIPRNLRVGLADCAIGPARTAPDEDLPLPLCSLGPVSPLTIVRGPAGSGKTEHLVALLAERYQRDPFTPALVLVPSTAHADQFRRRLVERCGVALALDVKTPSAYARDIVGAGQFVPVDVSRELLRRVSDREIRSGRADYFRPIASTSGLTDLIAEAVAALLSDQVRAAELARAAETSGDPSLGALASIYRAYRRELRARAARSGRGWVDPQALPETAAAALRAGADAGPPTVVIWDGFRTIRAGDRELIAAQAEMTDVVVALDPSASRAAEHGERALRIRIPGADEVSLDRPPPGVERVARTLPDAEAQLRAIAREIKHELARRPDLRPSDFAVTFRQISGVRSLAQQVFAEYELPLDSASAEPLSHTPLGTWLRRLLGLPGGDWRLRDVLWVLSSPLVDRRRLALTSNALDLVGRRARARRLWSGAEALGRIGDLLRAEGREHSERTGRVFGEAADAFERALGALFELLEAGPAESPGTRARRLDEALFGPAALLLAEDGTRGEQVSSALRRQLGALTATEEWLEPRAVSWETFVAEIEGRLERAGVRLGVAGGVFLAPAEKLYGLRWAQLAVGGLIEGEFPRPWRARGLLDDRARTKLAAHGLELAPPEASEDELWESVVSRPGERLSLWRPRVDDRGRPHAPSYYFQPAAGQQVLQTDGITPEQSASSRELAVAITSGWRQGERRRPPDYPAWETVRSAVVHEQQRRSFGGAGRFEGVLPAGVLPRLTGPDAVWSASRLETYLSCPFRFFAGYGLRLREPDEEMESADAATRGTVVHEMLEDALSELTAGGEPLVPATIDRVVRALRARGPDLWRAAPERHGFGRAALWQFEGPGTLDMIESLLRDEARQNAELAVTATLGTEVELSGEVPAEPYPIRLTAKIDRLDRGQELLQVVDYKSGRTISRGMLEGDLRVQLQLYAYLAGEQYAGERTVARYAYLDPSGRPWQLDTEQPGDRDLIETALARVRAVRADVEGGDLRVSPRERECPSYCDARTICRVNEFSRRKRWS